MVRKGCGRHAAAHSLVKPFVYIYFFVIIGVIESLRGLFFAFVPILWKGHPFCGTVSSPTKKGQLKREIDIPKDVFFAAYLGIFGGKRLCPTASETMTEYEKAQKILDQLVRYIGIRQNTSFEEVIARSIEFSQQKKLICLVGTTFPFVEVYHPGDKYSAVISINGDAVSLRVAVDQNELNVGFREKGINWARFNHFNELVITWEI